MRRSLNNDPRPLPPQPLSHPSPPSASSFSAHRWSSSAHLPGSRTYCHRRPPHLLSSVHHSRPMPIYHITSLRPSPQSISPCLIPLGRHQSNRHLSSIALYIALFQFSLSSLPYDDRHVRFPTTPFAIVRFNDTFPHLPSQFIAPTLWHVHDLFRGVAWNIWQCNNLMLPRIVPNHPSPLMAPHPALVANSTCFTPYRRP